MTCRSAALLAQLRLVRVERHLEVEGIDDVEHVALVDELVVDDADFRDLPRHLGRDARDLHADAAVSRPGRGDIGVPDDQRGEHGEDEDEQGRRRLERFPSETSHTTWTPGRRPFQRRLCVDGQTLARIRDRRTPFQSSASLLARRRGGDVKHGALGRPRTRLGDVGRRSVV